MSTKIDDLPGPDYKLKPESSVKKSVRFEEQVVDDHKKSEESESVGVLNKETKTALYTELINEENLLLIGVLYLATFSGVDGILTKVPGINLSGVWLTLTKCILLMIVYVASKKFILPRIKL
jgi:hypothetical protein